MDITNINEVKKETNFNCKSGYKDFEEINKRFGEDTYSCNGCPNFMYRDGMMGCKLIGGI